MESTSKWRKALKDFFALSFDHGHVMGSVSGQKTERGQVSQFLQTHYVSLISWCLLLWLELGRSERTIIRLHPAFTKGEKGYCCRSTAVYLKLPSVMFKIIHYTSEWPTTNRHAFQSYTFETDKPILLILVIYNFELWLCYEYHILCSF